jgi:hypothetical protein
VKEIPMSPVAAKTPRNPSTEIVYDYASGRLVRATSRQTLAWEEWTALSGTERAAALRGVPAARRVHVVAEIEARGRKPIGEPDRATIRRFRVAVTAARADLGNTQQPEAARLFAEAVARHTGGKSLAGMARDAKFQGRPLARLPELLVPGGLMVGMVVQLVHAARATDRGARPTMHWLTYLGRDSDGTPRFADLQRDDWSPAALRSAFGGWTLDGVLDPHVARR